MREGHDNAAGDEENTACEAAKYHFASCCKTYTLNFITMNWTR